MDNKATNGRARPGCGPWLYVPPDQIDAARSAAPGCRVLDGYGRTLVDEVEQLRRENDRLHRLKSRPGVAWLSSLILLAGLLACAVATLPARDTVLYAWGAVGSWLTFAVLVPLLGGPGGKS